MSFLWYLWGARNHCCFILELWLIPFQTWKWHQPLTEWQTWWCQEGKEIQVERCHPSQGKCCDSAGVPQATAGKASACKWDSSACTRRHWVLICPVGVWGPAQKVPLCERWNEGKELFPLPGALPGLRGEQSDLSLQWPGLNQHLFVHSSPGPSCGGRCCPCRQQEDPGQCGLAVWVGAAHSSQPAACDISVRSRHPFLGSFPPPDHSLCRLQYCLWSRLQAQAKKSKLVNFWDTIRSFPAEGLVLWRKRYQSNQRSLSDSIYLGFFRVSFPKLPCRLNYYCMSSVVQFQVQLTLQQLHSRWAQIRSVSARKTK